MAVFRSKMCHQDDEILNNLMSQLYFRAQGYKYDDPVIRKRDGRSATGCYQKHRPVKMEDTE